MIKKCKPIKEDVNLFRNRISVELDQKINGIISFRNEITTDFPKRVIINQIPLPCLQFICNWKLSIELILNIMQYMLQVSVNIFDYIRNPLG